MRAGATAGSHAASPETPIAHLLLFVGSRRSLVIFVMLHGNLAQGPGRNSWSLLMLMLHGNLAQVPGSWKELMVTSNVEA